VDGEAGQPLSALLPILRSSFQGELLAWLILHPEQEFSLTELSGRLGASRSTVSREADQFVAAGLVTDQRRGNLRLLRANTDNLIAAPLSELLALTYGPVAVLGEMRRSAPDKQGRPHRCVRRGIGSA
jgi:DNA-binding transcriptional ArsR family regulator